MPTPPGQTPDYYAGSQGYTLVYQPGVSPPNCYVYSPPPSSPSCADTGQLGTYPNCYTAPSCTPDSSCAATTCQGSTCTDTCGTIYVGSKICTYSQGTYTPSEAYYYSQGYYQSVYYTQSAYTPVYSYSQGYYQGYYQSSYAPVSTCGSGVSPAIAASPTIVKQGSTSTITWSATGISAGTSCTISGANVGGAGVNSVTSALADSLCQISSGSKTPTISGQTVFTITCSGTSKTVTVNVVPSVREF